MPSNSPSPTLSLPLLRGALILIWACLAACASSAADYDPVPTLDPRPLPPGAARTLADLLAADPPTRNEVDLARRFRRTVSLPPNQTASAGETAVFWVLIPEKGTRHRVTADLAAQGDRLNIWLEEGLRVDPAVVAAAVQKMENDLLPTTAAIFASEQGLAFLSGRRLDLLHVRDLGQRANGYFSAADTLPLGVNPYGNGRWMFVLNLGLVDIDTPSYYETVAHELQHMLQWAADPAEDAWLNEGLSELSTYLNGYGESHHLLAFLDQPDTPLLHFEGGGADYGAAYLLARYLYDRFGPAFIGRLADDEATGTLAIERTLSAVGTTLSFEALFAEWVLANLASAGPWPDASSEEHYGADSWPGRLHLELLSPGWPQTASVSQFGTDYWLLEGEGPLVLTFAGSTRVPLLDTAPAGGKMFWSTVPADGADMTLTRQIDLSGVDSATLQFQTWYDIELGWDYAYAAVSVDEGETWQTLSTIATSTADPHGQNLGHGLTGMSGGRSEPEWISLAADLSPFAGEPAVWLRFEYVTDVARHGQGWALDDIAIPEIDFFDGAEADISGWTAAGFVRHGNVLPQSFAVQLVTMDGAGRLMTALLPLAGANEGRWTIIPEGLEGPAVVAVSGITPVTFLPAGYEIGLEEGS